MPAMEWMLELVLVVLLLATLYQALRLERALGVLKRDRGELESLVIGFNASTRQAEAGVERLRSAAEGAGRQIERQVAASVSLKDDLSFLTERGDRLADRLDMLVRAARPLVNDAIPTLPPTTQALAVPTLVAPTLAHTAAPAAISDPLAKRAPATRTQAENGLLHALRLPR